MPSVSVIMPAYNAQATIRRAVDSILDQTWKDLELIVVDDGSTDQTAEILSQIHDRRLRTIHTSNRGVAAAANLGLDVCTGRWIARMDADDFAYAHRIEKQVQRLQADPLDVVGAQVRILDPAGDPVDSMKRYARWINRETLDSREIHALRFVEFPLVNPTLLGTRKFFELRYADDGLPEDYDLFLRGAHQGFRFGKVREVLLDWYELDSGLTRTHPRYSQAAFDRCRKKHLLEGPLRRVSTVDLWGLGATGKPWLSWLLSRNIEVRHCYEVNPRKIGQRIHGQRVKDCEQLQRSDETPLLIAVGRQGARELIHSFLKERDYAPGRNAWFVA